MATDTIFIDGLHLSAIVGLDCWGRLRAQPIVISIYLHLAPDGFLSRAGKSDSINDTIDYGSLTKAVTRYVEEKEDGFDGVGQLIDGVAKKAFEAAGESGKAVRVVVELPKLVPLAENGMAVEVTATRGAQIPARKVYIKDLILSVVIGVNEPERKEKQRVVVNLEVCEQENVTIDNYQNIVRCISSVSQAGSSCITISHCIMP